MLTALMFNFGWEKLLQFAALILSIVNGLILIRVHIRDRAKLDIVPIHPDTYQWWFRLPDSTFEGHQSRIFGFLVYISILNRGYRAVLSSDGASESGLATGDSPNYDL